MNLWLFFECRWCGFHGCAAPIGERCPRCGRLDATEPVRPAATAAETAR